MQLLTSVDECFWRWFDCRIHRRGRLNEDTGTRESIPRGINRGDVITEINAALSFRWQPKLPVLAFISRVIIPGLASPVLYRDSFSLCSFPSPPESNLRTRENGFKFYLSVGPRFTRANGAAGGHSLFASDLYHSFACSTVVWFVSRSVLWKKQSAKKISLRRIQYYYYT